MSATPPIPPLPGNNPPPIPVQSLGYATPTGAGGFHQSAGAQGAYVKPYKSIYHQAARASWIAPVIAFALGFCTFGASSRVDAAPAQAKIIAYANMGLIALGFLLGIFALLGLKKYGPRGILVDAIIGLLISGALLALFISGLMAASSRNRAAAAAGRNAPSRTITPPSSPQSPVRQTGWLGARNHNTVGIAVVAMDDAHQETTELITDLGLRQPCSVLLVDVANKGATPITISTRSAILIFTDGTTTPALDPTTVLKMSDPESNKVLTRTAAPAGSASLMIFIPKGAAGAKLAGVTIDVDGENIETPGRVMSAEEKTPLFNAIPKR